MDAFNVLGEQRLRHEWVRVRIDSSSGRIAVTVHIAVAIFSASSWIERNGRGVNSNARG